MSLSPGTRLGPYEIASVIGAGGMGEVYRAKDTRLGREVAIKILPTALASDASAVARFEQEARAVAALSHPNIVAIYDVGHQDDIAFVVMELLAGQTLRERLGSGRLPLGNAVEYARQVAHGLAAAHARSIAHRDIKPENIFITTDGHVKILDFGLAKVAATPAAADETRLETRRQHHTEAGTVLGTTGYLSPEQAQGRSVDHRADIFAFGAVLYEMTTGTRAFKGDSTIDTLHKIVHSDPPAVDSLNADAPGELKWLLAKCLAKDPDERYQSTRDLVVDLKTLARSLESSPRLTGVASAAPVGPTRAASRRTLVTWMALVAGVVIVAAAMLWFRGGRAPVTDAPATGRLSMERITASGDVIDAVISPDGKYVGYVVSSGGQQSLWIRQLATASTLQLVPPAVVGYWGAMFTPDGSALDYVIVGAGVPTRALFRVPALGGASRRLLDGLASFPVFSPNGTQIAFMRESSPQPGSSAVWIADADGSHARLLASRTAPEFFVPLFFTAPAWSPDGTVIVCPMERRTGKTVGTLVAYRVTDGVEQPFPHYEFPNVGQATWAPDGQGLIVIGAVDQKEGQLGASSSSPTRNSNMQVWWVSAHEPSRRRITNDLLDYRVASMTADGSALLTVSSESTSSIWTAPLDGAGAPARVSTGRYDGIEGIAAAPHHRILYRSVDSGVASIWAMNEDGSGKSQVTTEGVTAQPSMTTDGTSMVFTRDGAGLWISDADGQHARPIAGTIGASDPAVTPDGKWVFYISAPKGLGELWKAATDNSSAPKPVLENETLRPAVSPDGTQIAFFYREGPATPYMVAAMPIGATHPTAMFPVALSSTSSMVRWTLDGKALLHNTAPKDRSNIWLQPLSGGPLRQVTHFADQLVLGFDRSSDGKQLVIARGVFSRDAVLFRNFR